MAAENRDVERAIIAATLRSEGTATSILELDGSDFTDPRHRVIAATLRDMMRRDVPVTELTLINELEARGKLNTPGGAGGRMYVFDIASTLAMGVHAEYDADILRSATRLRMFEAAANRAAARANDDEAAANLDELIRLHRAELDKIPAPFGNADTDDTIDQLGTILSEQDRETDWLIPGWIAREERAVIVAGEGVAKTTMLRQFAICCAAGLNPWTKQRVADGMRVLFIDAENSRDQSRRAYRWIASRCYSPMMAHGWKERLIHKTRNDGVNLLGRDELWFRELADRISPDLIILSPAYKLMRGDPKEDRDVLGLLDVIDRVRVQHKAAVLIETHAPHGQFTTRDMRPFGSSVWLRWPEIGMGYQRDTDSLEGKKTAKPEYLEAVDWRGAREPRDWPDLLRYGDPRRQEPPWVPTRDGWAPSVDMNYQAKDEAA